jgi:D-glycero-alpha-D-manno-heptose 1-phosphate guanylyltransferase
MEAIILAGGLGTRLRGVLPDLPKAMAPIRGRPFLALLLDQLAGAGFRRVILAVGYRHEAIRRYFGERQDRVDLRYSVETEPLGTGGAIRLALGQADSPQTFVLNGDTYAEVDYASMLLAHRTAAVALTVAVHEVADVGRYGALDVCDGRIRGFLEKGRGGPGMINAGVYLLSTGLLAGYDLPGAFSFETDFLMRYVHDLRPLAFATGGTFIDIGVPEDYARAQALLASRAPAA